MKLTKEQVSILNDGRIDWNRFYLQWQLDRKQYTSINEVLETIWLKRNRKEKAHIADCTPDELIEAIADIIETGDVETLKETIKKFQFYETPKEVAEYLVELADIKESDMVLEPSAWHGAIVDCIKNKDFAWLCMYEIDEKKCQVLKDKWYHNPNNKDFLLSWSHWIWYDRIIANPPFSKSQDVKHILKMYETLAIWGRIVSIASSSIKTREGKLYDELKALNPRFIELPEWSFKESWTMVNTVILIIDK